MSRVTQDAAMPNCASDKGLSPSTAALSRAVLLTRMVQRRGPTTPAMRCHNAGLGSSPVARHYWGNHSIIFSSSGY